MCFIHPEFQARFREVGIDYRSDRSILENLSDSTWEEANIVFFYDAIRQNPQQYFMRALLGPKHIGVDEIVGSTLCVQGFQPNLPNNPFRIVDVNLPVVRIEQILVTPTPGVRFVIPAPDPSRHNLLSPCASANCPCHQYRCIESDSNDEICVCMHPKQGHFFGTSVSVLLQSYFIEKILTILEDVLLAPGLKDALFLILLHFSGVPAPVAPALLVCFHFSS
jgi:hypothetical protein